PDLSQPAMVLRDALPDDGAISHIALHIELETLRSIYDRREERDDRFEDRVTAALSDMTRLAPVLTMPSPDVQEIEMALRDYADPRHEFIVSLDKIADAIRAQSDLFGQKLQVISHAVTDDTLVQMPRVAAAGDKTYRNTLIWVGTLFLTAGTAPTMGVVGTEIMTMTAQWVAAYHADLIALAGNYGTTMKTMMEDTVVAAQTWWDKHRSEGGDDA
ncbi:MAG: hypothetical protein AAF701_06435, partial [Pseudomonadota bacterium]